MEFTAKTISKEEVPQGLRFTVEFTNGTKSFVETIIPQDEVGLLLWVKSRLTSLNSTLTLPTQYPDGGVIVTALTPIVLTQAQIDQNQFFDDLNRYNRIKTYLIEPGFVSVDDTDVAALSAKIKTNFKPEYLNFI